MTKALLLALVCACLAAGVYSRELMGDSICPFGCKTGKCIKDKTTGQYRCTECVSNLMVIKTPNGDIGKCGCRAGRSWVDTETSTANGAAQDLYNNYYRCAPCAKGSYCPGGVQTGASTTTCGAGLTTLAGGAKSKWQCVEEAGYAYSIDTTVNPHAPKATVCAQNTYNAGLQKKKCTACPAGFVTATETTALSSNHDAADDCLVPAGYYLRAPGEIAPCPQGEYKAGTTAAKKCTACGDGVTTAEDKSTDAGDCKIILPGYYATGVSATGAAATAAVCPKNYWCPGKITPSAAVTTVTDAGDANAGLQRCSETGGAISGTNALPLWTEGTGATSANDCLIPPGYQDKLDHEVVECAERTYREGWTKATLNTATTCSNCANGPAGFTSEGTVTLATADAQVQVRGSTASCVLMPGYGMYRKGSGFTVVACAVKSYGSAAKVYGLGAVPCRPCPTGLITGTLSTATAISNSDGTSTATGWTSPLACVTDQGFGYDGVVSTQCAQGTYNSGNNRQECAQCLFGSTTAGLGSTADTQCRAAPGYFKDGGSYAECPIATYADAIATTETERTSCTPCGGHKTTLSTGSDAASDCSLCTAGYGGTTCATLCSSEDKYGPADRQNTDCIPCPAETTFRHDKAPSESWYSGPVAKASATSKADCVSKFAQIESGLWYLPGAVVDPVDTVTTFAGCATACSTDDACQFFTFDYSTTACKLRKHAVGSGTGATLAFKAVPAGTVAGAASVGGKAIASGLYTSWQYTDAAEASLSALAPVDVADQSPSACLQACDADDQCAAVWIGSNDLSSPVSVTCKIIKGQSTPDGGDVNKKRSMTKALQANLA